MHTTRALDQETAGEVNERGTVTIGFAQNRKSRVDRLASPKKKAGCLMVTRLSTQADTARNAKAVLVPLLLHRHV